MIRTDASHGAARDGAAVGGCVRVATSVGDPAAVGDRVRVATAVGDPVRSGEMQSHSVGIVTGRHVRGIRWQNCAAWSAAVAPVLEVRPFLPVDVRST